MERRKWTYFYDTIHRLKTRTDIIIKPADKNLGIAVMKKDWYLPEALDTTYLEDTNTYQAMEQPNDIEPIIEQLNAICTNQTWLPTNKIQILVRDLTSYHTINRVKLCRTYFLPKLHKPIQALRPICASFECITY